MGVAGHSDDPGGRTYPALVEMLLLGVPGAPTEARNAGVARFLKGGGAQGRI
jgi:hypothetical protein